MIPALPVRRLAPRVAQCLVQSCTATEWRAKLSPASVSRSSAASESDCELWACAFRLHQPHLLESFCSDLGGGWFWAGLNPAAAKGLATHTPAHQPRDSGQAPGVPSSQPSSGASFTPAQSRGLATPALSSAGTSQAEVTPQASTHTRTHMKYPTFKTWERQRLQRRPWTNRQGPAEAKGNVCRLPSPALGRWGQEGGSAPCPI